MSGKARKLRHVPPEEKALTESFVRMVRLLGPRRRPSVGVRAVLISILSKPGVQVRGWDPIQRLCGLVEWYMHTKRKTWDSDVERGIRWRDAVENWLNENRAHLSAVVLAYAGGAK